MKLGPHIFIPGLSNSRVWVNLWSLRKAQIMYLIHKLSRDYIIQIHCFKIFSSKICFSIIHIQRLNSKVGT